MIDYLKLLDKDLLTDCKMMSINENPEKYFELIFKGWNPHYIFSADKEMEEIIELGSLNIQFIVSKYKETHSFTEPQFAFLPPMHFSVKIGIKRRLDNALE